MTSNITNSSDEEDQGNPLLWTNIQNKVNGNITNSSDEEGQGNPLLGTNIKNKVNGAKNLETKLQGTSLTVRDVGRIALNRNVGILKKEMKPKFLIDKLREKCVFNEIDLKDLEDLTKTSDKNAFIFKQMCDKYVLREDKYNQFKTCLREIDLGFLVDELEKSEDDIICKSEDDITCKSEDDITCKSEDDIT
ncbi:uncharacterized protein LOC132724925, partial [Ruditapes philippinarum]|uniref:uncharacterized protein LOC132724925 n=1 Tax=Ruditapes philippinarum TaxID=129788 RepID=UPI00295AD7AA